MTQSPLTVRTGPFLGEAGPHCLSKTINPGWEFLPLTHIYSHLKENTRSSEGMGYTGGGGRSYTIRCRSVLDFFVSPFVNATYLKIKTERVKKEGRRKEKREGGKKGHKVRASLFHLP